ncbi:MAG: hypothetical protein ACOZQL_06870 [Myxococcota bacterium]
MKRDRQFWVRGLLSLALFVAALGVIGWFRGRLDRALADLPVEERRALYQRTLENLRTCSRNGGEALSPYCEDQAAFIRHFPECDQPCRALARDLAPRATR